MKLTRNWQSVARKTLLPFPVAGSAGDYPLTRERFSDFSGLTPRESERALGEWRMKNPDIHYLSLPELAGIAIKERIIQDLDL